MRIRTDGVIVQVVMNRKISGRFTNAIAVVSAAFLSACTATVQQSAHPDGFQAEQAASLIPFRVLDAINAVRLHEGLPRVALSSELTAAAKTHAQDMNLQNRPWHFGSDGSSPVDRAGRAGYVGWLIGENISESYETDIETVLAWMKDDESRAVMLDPDARRAGVGWYQRKSGKTWWVLVIGA